MMATAFLFRPADGPLPLAVGLLSVVAGTVFVAVSWSRCRRGVDDDPYSIKPCPNPQCVRCRQYATAQRQAVRKLPWIIEEASSSSSAPSSLGTTILDRVAEGVSRCSGRNDGRKNRSADMSPALGQYPTVLLVPRLYTRPNVTKMHRQSCRLLEDAARSIRAELVRARRHEDIFVWTHNDTSSSSTKIGGTNTTTTASEPWKVLHLMNQGRWADDNDDGMLAKLFPQTMSAVAALKNLDDTLLDGCIFGNVFFSRLTAGTTIDVHCGPTNVRHRLHLTIVPYNDYVDDNNDDDSTTTASPSSAAAPTTMTLHVRDKVMTWRPYRAFVFDDSLPHGVSTTTTTITGDHGDSSSNNNENNQQERIVLIVDLWHPDLTAAERHALRQLYPNKNPLS